MTQPQAPPSAEALGDLKETIEQHREFLQAQINMLSVLGKDKALIAHIELALSFRVDRIVDAGLVLYELSEAYSQLESAIGEVRLDSLSKWADSVGGEDFREYLNSLAEHLVAPDNACLQQRAILTGTTMLEFAYGLLAWQLAIAQAIRDASAARDQQEQQIRGLIGGGGFDLISPFIGVALALAETVQMIHDDEQFKAQFWINEFAKATQLKLGDPQSHGAHLIATRQDQPAYSPRIG